MSENTLVGDKVVTTHTQEEVKKAIETLKDSYARAYSEIEREEAAKILADVLESKRPLETLGKMENVIRACAYGDRNFGVRFRCVYALSDKIIQMRQELKKHDQKVT